MAETPSREEVQRRLPSLYDSAGALEIELEGGADGNAPLTAAQVGAFNQILADARALLPGSVALREDVSEATASSRPADVQRALNVTIVPALHNALPPQAYDERA